jgi:hypothetical protein
MTRRISFWFALLGSYGLPALALAQSSTPSTPTNQTPAGSTIGGLTVTLLTVGDDAYAMVGVPKPLGKTACDQNLNLHFRVSGFPVGPTSDKYVEIYRGSACNTTDSKDGVGDDECVRIQFENRNQSSPVQEFDVAISEVCSSEGDVTIWFLPVDTLNTNASVLPYGAFDLPLDVVPPDAPANVRGGSGETEIPVKWERNDETISRNWLVWDPNPVMGEDLDAGGESGGQVCGSANLMPGQAIDLSNLPQGLRRREIVGDVASAKLSGDEVGSKAAAVAVVAQDLAGNDSVLSNTACIFVVPTMGFWKAYLEEGGDAEQGCVCSLPGAGGPTGGHPMRGVFAVLGLFAVCWRLRRKRQSS